MAGSGMLGLPAAMIGMAGLYIAIVAFTGYSAVAAFTVYPRRWAAEYASNGNDWWWQETHPDTFTNSGLLFWSSAIAFSTDCLIMSESEAPAFFSTSTTGVYPRRNAHVRAVSPLLFLAAGSTPSAINFSTRVGSAASLYAAHIKVVEPKPSVTRTLAPFAIMASTIGRLCCIRA